MRSPLPAVLAVLLPALVLSAAALWLGAEPPRVLTPAAAAEDAALAKAPPGIVIVGNSKSRSDLDGALLKRALGYDKAVANVLVAGSSAPAWYALLEQRVFANGHRPELIVVYGQLAALLRVEAESAGERKGLEEQLTGPSPVLERKVLGRSGGALGPFRRNATEAHDALLTAVRDLAVGLIAEPSPDGLRAAGKARAEPALERTFGSNARYLAGGGARVVPVAERSFSGAMTASDVPPDASLLPDLIDLAAANGARIVFVRAPLPEASRYLDTLAPEVENAAFAVINDKGASYLDLQGLALPATAWRDHMHASIAGQGQVTKALAAAMDAAKLLDGGVAPARPALLPAAVARVGALPAAPTATFEPAPGRPCGLQAPLPDHAFLSDDALQAGGFGRASPLVLVDAAGEIPAHSPEGNLGATCVGGWQHRRMGAIVSPRTAGASEGLALAFAEAPSVEDQKGEAVWWVYPGTATEWRYDAPWPDGPVKVRVTARAARGGGATLRVGATEVALTPRGRLLAATIEVPAPAAPWSVSVTADADTWLVVDELVLGDQRLLGQPPTTLSPLLRAPEAPAAPPAVTPGPVGSDGVLTTIAVPGLGHVSDDELRERAAYPCSPLQITPEREPDGWMNEGHLLDSMLRKGRRGYGHVGERLLVAAASDRMPAGPYAVRLDPRRKCGNGTWVYPGDELRWKVVAATDKLRLGADRLVLEGLALVPEGDARASVPLDVRVQVTNKEQAVERPLDLPTQGGFARVCLPLDPPLPPAAWMDLTLRAPDDAWFVVQSVQIGESEHLAGCEE